MKVPIINTWLSVAQIGRYIIYWSITVDLLIGRYIFSFNLLNFFESYLPNWKFFIIFSSIALIGILLGVFTRFTINSKKNSNTTRILVCGTDFESQIMIDQLKSCEHPILIVGLWEENINNNEKEKVKGYSVYRGYKELSTVLRSGSIDLIYLCPTIVPSDVQQKLHHIANQHNIKIREHYPIELKHILAAKFGLDKYPSKIVDQIPIGGSKS